MRSLVIIIVGTVLIIVGIVSGKILVPRSHVHAKLFSGYLGSVNSWKAGWIGIWIGGIVIGIACVVYGAVILILGN